MASKYDWDFIRPLDQTSSIAALAQGNQQIQAGLQGVGNAVTGYADAMRQQNTDAILNTLMGAQTSADLPNTMDAVRVLQQQYGRGYDQTAVRNAIDNRGATLAQRDLQSIGLQQAQAAQAAIPQINALNAQRMQAAGATPEQISALQAIQGIDTSTLAQQQVGDLRDQRDFDYRKGVNDRDYAYRQLRDRIGDDQWAEGNTRANISAMASLAQNYVTPGTQGYGVDANGNITTVGSPGVTFADAMPLMASIFNAESKNIHRNSKGELTRSPAGALGVAQIMPNTAAKPGYGMKPINLQTSSADQQKAWATEYIGRIQKAHGFSTEQAVAAYNAGPGRVQDAIKKGGNNWLAQLPKETQNYVPKVLGGAQQGIGRPVSQANMSKVTSQYQDAIAKLETDFSVNQAKSQTTGSLATTGKNVDTWVAGNKDGGLLFANNDTFFTKASDLAKMAKADSAFNKLPESAQMNVLEGAYAKMNDVNAFQYVPDGDLKKFISRESSNYQKNLVEQHKQARNALTEQAYQNVVQQYQAVGSQPPNRESVLQMLDPQYKPKQQAQAKAQPTPKASTPVTQQPVRVTNAKAEAQAKQMDAYLAKRNAERAARGSQPKATKTTQPAKATPKVSLAGNMKNLPSGSMSQKEIDDLLKKYNVR